MRILNLERSKFFIDRTHLRNTVSLMLLKECLCNMQILDGPLNFPGATEDAQFLIAFKKLIKKVKRWKRHGRWKWNNIASTSSLLV
ncbi:hypothetical protein ZWY2020_052077 [Hordeum vulgare]|nr:hypothetical protein ZWY2020_052077 [Hordeum vulgare]